MDHNEYLATKPPYMDKWSERLRTQDLVKLVLDYVNKSNLTKKLKLFGDGPTMYAMLMHNKQNIWIDYAIFIQKKILKPIGDHSLPNQKESYHEPFKQ